MAYRDLITSLKFNYWHHWTPQRYHQWDICMYKLTRGKFIYLFSEFMVKTINIPMQVVVVQFHFWWFMAMILDWVLEHSIEDDQSLDLFARKLCLMLLLHVGIKEIVGVRLISLSLSSCFFEQLITSFFPSTLIHFHKRLLEFFFFPTAIFFHIC